MTKAEARKLHNFCHCMADVEGNFTEVEVEARNIYGNWNSMSFSMAQNQQEKSCGTRRIPVNQRDVATMVMKIYDFTRVLILSQSNDCMYKQLDSIVKPERAPVMMWNQVFSTIYILKSLWLCMILTATDRFETYTLLKE